MLPLVCSVEFVFRPCGGFGVSLVLAQRSQTKIVVLLFCFAFQAPFLSVLILD